MGDLLAARRPGHTLPAGLYKRRDVFETDLDVFFHRQWILVGMEIDVPESGDVNVVDIGNSSVLIVRDDDGIVRAFHNVCRHRGARLRDAGKGAVGKLVCPYHQWTYELTGDLLHAPHMGKGFDAACHGMRGVHLRIVAGLLFVCLADEPPADLADLESAMVPRLAPYDLRNARIAFEKEIVEEGNWKLTMENNRECYHCAGSHPELVVSFVAQDFGFDPDELSPEDRAASEEHDAEFARRTAEWERLGYPSRPIEHLAGHVTNFRTERLMMGAGGGAESATLDGKRACRRLLGNLDRADLGDLHFWTHHSWHHYMCDHAVITFAVPIAPGRTRVRSVWIVHKDAVEGVDYDLDNLIRVWDATNDQDSHLVGIAFKGVCSSGYRPGRYSPFTERHLDGFCDWYIERMQAAGL
jgi:Rieske 2Fe-2S family protein